MPFGRGADSHRLDVDETGWNPGRRVTHEEVVQPLFIDLQAGFNVYVE